MYNLITLIFIERTMALSWLRMNRCCKLLVLNQFNRSTRCVLLVDMCCLFLKLLGPDVLISSILITSKMTYGCSAPDFTRYCWDLFVYWCCTQLTMHFHLLPYVHVCRLYHARIHCMLSFLSFRYVEQYKDMLWRAEYIFISCTVQKWKSQHQSVYHGCSFAYKN